MLRVSSNALVHDKSIPVTTKKIYVAVAGKAHCCSTDRFGTDFEIDARYARPAFGAPMDASCSARILGPFLRLASTRDSVRGLVPDAFWSLGSDVRVSLDSAQTMLLQGVERLRDEQLGLKLGQTMRFGEGGAFDYAVRSAPTLRESVNVAGRYSGLICDSLRIWFEIWQERALIRVHDDISWSRPCADFSMSAIYRIHVSDEVPSAAKPECWFPYPEPRDTSEHERAFAGAALHFNAPFCGFAFNRAYEKAPMPGADPVLHSMLCEEASSLMVRLSHAHSVRTRVRARIEHEIRQCGTATAPRVARAIHMSRRAMSRRLELEGTTFGGELDSVKRELALVSVRESHVPLIEIAYSLGFSHVESFHRAFRRWTGRTPAEDRARAAAVPIEPDRILSAKALLEAN